MNDITKKHGVTISFLTAKIKSNFIFLNKIHIECSYEYSLFVITWILTFTLKDKKDELIKIELKDVKENLTPQEIYKAYALELKQRYPELIVRYS